MCFEAAEQLCSSAQFSDSQVGCRKRLQSAMSWYWMTLVPSQGVLGNPKGAYKTRQDTTRHDKTRQLVLS